MDDRYFDKEHFEKYVGKWCLFRHSYDKEYEKIFVAAIKDGIMKYSTDKIRWSYCDIDEFLGYSYFFVSPIDNDSEDDISVKSDSTASDVEWKERNPLDENVRTVNSNCNCSDCDHDWIETILASYPPIYQRTCKKCGKQQHIPRQNSSSNIGEGWVDGAY